PSLTVHGDEAAALQRGRAVSEMRIHLKSWHQGTGIAKLSRMRSICIAVLSVLLGVSLIAQQPTFRSSTRIVPVITTVTDADKRLVPNLEQVEFTILDNGKPQPISFFLNEVQPFSVVVMLDTSASMTASIELLKAASVQFLLRMLPVDKGQVGAFNDKIQLSGKFTPDRDDLIDALS